MRPVLLEMQGFGAFKQPTTVHFDDTDLFALVGPTGSGKSTVIDAVCFALYGSVPRYDDLKAVAPAMSVGHTETKVRLTFEVGGRPYVAVRVVRRNKDGRSATTKEARLEAGDGTVLAGRASEMTAAVESLLGLPFEHFTRCVVLPQGAFARFLHDSPADRQELLVQLLDLAVYARMAVVANQRARAAQVEAQGLRHALDGLAQATPDALTGARSAADHLAAALAAVEERLPRLAALDEERAAVVRSGQSARSLLDALGRVGVPAQALDAGAAAGRAALVLADAEAEQAAAQEATDAAAATVAGLGDPAPLRRALDAHERRTVAVAALGDAREQVAAAAGALVAAAGGLDDAVAAATSCAELLDAARTRHAAHAVRSVLVVGAPCPVCQQLVTALPGGSAPDQLTAAEAASAAATAALERARAAREAASLAAATADERLATAAGMVAELDAAVADHPDVDTVRAALDAHAAATEAEGAARRRVETTRRATAAAAAAAAAARAAVSALAAAYSAQRDPVVALDPPAPGADVVASWEALAAWAADRIPEQDAAVLARRAELQSVDAERQTIVDECRARAAGVGVDGATPDELVRGLVQALARARAAAEQLERQVVERERLAGLAAEAEERHTVARAMGQLLSANGFEKWLVAEALGTLVDGAGQTLRQLSSGQFSLAAGDGGELVVIDHANGDERRGVRSLSGGETFQASLALALSLADHLAGLAASGAAKLEALFLDEGFGTLDAESLDTVASAIESLGATGRMVGIVTHVRDLAERVPVRFEVTKGTVSATVERVVG